MWVMLDTGAVERVTCSVHYNNNNIVMCIYNDYDDGDGVPFLCIDCSAM